MDTEIFQVADGKMTLNFEKETVKRLWDNYYILFCGFFFRCTFLSYAVNKDDNENYPIEMDVLTCPVFYGRQSLCGTADEQNISFSIQSGYLPVTKTANDKTAILSSGAKISQNMEKVLPVAVDMVNEN